jgi:hypothetical protein
MESPSSSTTTSSSSIGSPTQRMAFDFVPLTRTRKRRPKTVRGKAWANAGAALFARAITRTTDPLPPSNAPINPTPILRPPENDGFFVLASCIFHACVNPEPHHRGHRIETVRCPAHLRIISKNNLGFLNDSPVMDALIAVMRNQMSASEIIKETAYVSLQSIANISISIQRIFDQQMARATEQEMHKLSRLKELFETDCIKMRREIMQLTRATINEVDHAGPFKQLAIVFDHSDRCNRLIMSMGYRINTLVDTTTFNASTMRVSQKLDRSNFISYGDPKTRYLPTKTYSLTAPLLSYTASAVNHFIDRNLNRNLHLSVGLQVHGRMHTLQANVNLHALKAGTPVPNDVTMHEIVQLMMHPMLKMRIVELMCEQHPHLTDALLGDLGWDVALFDGGCSCIQGVSNCPFTVHVPSYGESRPHALLSAALPTEPTSATAAVPWDLEPVRRPASPRAVRLRKANEYLAPAESLHPVQASVFLTTPQERTSNDSTTTEVSLTPRDTLEEGGSRRTRMKTKRTYPRKMTLKKR